MLARWRRRAPVVPVGTYTDWHWPQAPAGYREMAWDLTPETDPSPAGYFWSHQVALLGGHAAYAGLQTLGSEPSGKIAIFSVWGAVACEGPTYAAPFTGEGAGQTVRIRFAWVPGATYRLRIAAAGPGWWQAWVGQAGAVGAEPIGRIQVPAGWSGLAPWSVVWTERYTGPLARCADLGHAVAVFGTPVADGSVTPTGHRNHLAANPGCGGSAVLDVPGGVRHVMGGPGGAAERHSGTENHTSSEN